ncbi:xylulokinase [Sediminicurvatus halobius]|uniref:Xylulose kinase n=1 Tax=Sediminicurvatus halobius TaxID=2182432 RepID=A0A2U2N173_9GAMM|nr:xylulokinase [Spiribacter halobius]PWG62798.1 xylulokinase [Spiribacter halobius]UEX77055.1 xylulokinase [Spiribacter halobius]
MPDSDLYLGIDLGTSALKAVLTDPTGAVRAEAEAGYAVSRPRPLWSEQQPEDWWQACRHALAQLAANGAPLDRVAAVGVAGQMHGAVLLDDRAAVLRPAILWNDGRSARECGELERRVPDLRRRTGNLCMPGFTAPKLLWVARHEPGLAARVARVLLPKDYLVHRLTGRFSTDPSDAAGTLWLDPARRDWDDTLLAACGLTRAHMPSLHEGCAVVGPVQPAAAATLGLPEVPVVAGAGDNAGGAVGAGVVQPGQGLLSLGTSGVIFVASDRHHPLPERTVHAFCHCLPRRWHQMTVTLSAAECLRWLAQVTGSAPGELIARLEASGRRETGVLFLPYLSGERTPHNDPDAVGLFHGLRADTDSTDLTLAVLEGVAFAFADGFEALQAAGSAPERLAIIGGGARSPLWRQLCADTLGVPLEYRESGAVGPACGAARLARLGARGGDVEAAIREDCLQPPLQATAEPDGSRRDYLAARLDRYRRLYRLTRPLHAAD